MPQHRVKAQVDKGIYDCLSAIKHEVDKSDYSIVNFESPIVSQSAYPIDKTGPNLCCTKNAMECISNAGFKCVTLANNHFRDYGQKGVEDTLNECKRLGIDYVGGGVNITEAQTILYKDINGERLAILNFCENEWSIATEEYGGSAPLIPIRNHYAILEAKKHAAYVLVIIHGGIEGYAFPTPRMVDTYRFFIDSGADAVINHHQHCYSGMELYKGKPIFYGIGNFCFDRKNKKNCNWNEGFMVSLNFSEVKIDYKVIPYTQCNEKPEVILMEGEQAEEFFKTLEALNNTISNPHALKKKIDDKVDKMYEKRLLTLEPLNNRIVKALQKRHLFPYLIRHEQRKSLLSRLRCETHRELLIAILEKYLRNLER